MNVRAQRVKRSRISAAFLDTAREVLSRVGSPTQVTELIDKALKIRPLQAAPQLLGQELYRTAKIGERGFVVKEYPSFRPKEPGPRTQLPNRGYVAAAMRVLNSPCAPPGYVDVREITRLAGEAGILHAHSPVPEYWMVVMMEEVPDVFLSLGQLTLGLMEWQQTPNVNGPMRKKRQTDGLSSGITEGIYERDIESLIAERLDLLESGLQLVGRQYSTPVGRIDLLCKDMRGNFVVVELKSFGAKTGEIVDQITRYMGWIRTHLASPHQIVRGIIVVGHVDENLGYAIVPIPNLEIRTFEVTIKNPPSFVSSDHK
jgi:hypothetical protein